MNTTLFTLGVRGKRDVIVAGVRARQIARLLGFDAHEQTLLAAAVFELAARLRERGSPVRLRFQVGGRLFRVCGPTEGTGHVERPLPAGSSLALEDLTWTVQQMERLAPVDPFAEMRRQNQELLRALHEQEHGERAAA